MTAAALVSLPAFALASAVAERAVAVVSDLGQIFFEPAPAAVAFVFDLALFFFERALVAAPVVFVVAVAVFGLASVLAEHDVAVVSDLGLTVVARAPAAVVFSVVAAVFVLVAFHADRAFALPAILSAHRPLC